MTKEFLQTIQKQITEQHKQIKNLLIPPLKMQTKKVNHIFTTTKNKQQHALCRKASNASLAVGTRGHGIQTEPAAACTLSQGKQRVLGRGHAQHSSLRFFRFVFFVVRMYHNRPQMHFPVGFFCHENAFRLSIHGLHLSSISQ